MGGRKERIYCVNDQKYFKGSDVYGDSFEEKTCHRGRSHRILLNFEQE